jgi:uncharacterized membrane protein YphA (DoxX/SURF4 family)
MTTSNKAVKITYWITTILLALFILPGIFFINSNLAIEGSRHLLLPEWLRYEVSIAQFIGGLILIIPLPKRIKEWGYVGMGIVYISAFIAHLSIDGVKPVAFQALLMFAILLVSYICYHKMNNSKKLNASYGLA